MPTLERGTKLQNKRSKKIITVIDHFQTVTEQSDWQSVTCYRCRAIGKWVYLYDYELSKYEVINNE